MNATVVCLNFESIGRLLHSFATAFALQQCTSITWKEYKESTVLNVIYAMMPWKGAPGFVEVDQNMRRARELTITKFEHCVGVFLEKLRQGPQAVAQYLSTIERLKDDCLQSVRDTFASASEINNDLISQTGTAIKQLAAIKAASSIALAGMTGGVVLAGGSIALIGGAGAVSFGYSVTGTVVKNWGEIKMAGALAIELGKEYGPQLVGKPMEAAGTAALFAASGKWLEAKESIDRLSKELARKVSKKKRARVGAKIAEVHSDFAQANTMAKRGTKLVNAGRNILRFAPVVFAATDILGAVSEYGEDTQGL